jgi:hypothetical protein
VFDSTDDEVSCKPKLTIGGETTELNAPVTYSASVTPVLKEMNKRYGTVLGGDELELTGTGFRKTATVLIDGEECEVSAQTKTKITCTTAKKPDSEEDPSL